ncbi:hypothetical protein QBC34DRAFT_406255 [Podospora aff. communis PSN243]|uniref:HPt domain-containing protein n=1 Tax=Podospora aff. communis PSN243 TaxID=3040156 RepID=A0AAV9GK10_9PEZI|nr:hypothetical protein QBC34DRAFT_406255 [Podospora aff. communis PSN243]
MDLLYKGDHIDREMFSQILEMDDDESHEFSKSLVVDYFEQFDRTADNIEEALRSRDAARLAELGHLLLAPSETLGLRKVAESCRVIKQCAEMEASERNEATWTQLKKVVVEMKDEAWKVQGRFALLYPGVPAVRVS